MVRLRFPSLVVLLATTGCYTFSPTTFDQIGPGVDVRARLTATEVDRLRDVLPGEGRVVEGAVVEKDDDALLIDVTVAASIQGMQLTSLNQRVQFQRDGITNLELKSLHRGRTWTAAGIFGVALTVFIYKQFLEDSGGPGGNIGGEPNEGLVRGLHVRLP